MSTRQAWPAPIARAQNDLLYDEGGRCWIDMFGANGTVWLGHANETVSAALHDQMTLVWNTGAVQTAIREKAFRAVNRMLPDGYTLAGLYSTGMEASEFALRYVRRISRRTGVVGFAGSMHGKSMATAYLGWDNEDGLRLADFVRLPFVDLQSEASLLHHLERELGKGTAGAVFVEPLQACNGGHGASNAFYRSVAQLCNRYEALLVFDEGLTGLYRTGSRFYFESCGVAPDVVLIGKALGNGFPVSGVVVKTDRPVTQDMLPGSTFAGNPLASSAVVGSLAELERVDAGTGAMRIGQVMKSALDQLDEERYILRGRGALWVIECPSPVEARAAAEQIYQQGVFPGYASRYLRLLPAVTIESEHLEKACAVISGVLSGKS